MELNSNLQTVRDAGVEVVAITPDAPDVLARFAREFDIGYPLLADVGGVIVDRFGVRNHNIAPNERQADGIPFPGHFLLDAAGTIVAKSFTGDLRHRPSGTVVVAERFGVYAGPSVTISAPELTVTVALSAGRVFGGQEVAVRVACDMAPGWHVYGAGAPAQYRALEVRIDEPRQLLATDEVAWPTPSTRTFAALGETVPVHEGRVEGHGRIRVRWSPPPSIFAGLEEAVRRRAVAPGTYALAGTLRYQACTDDVCRPPAEVAFTVPLVVEPTITAPPPAPR